MAEGDHNFIKEGIDVESLRKLKQTRGSKKGIVSRPQEEIRLFIKCVSCERET